MKFNIQERLLLLSILGTIQSNLATLRIVRDLQEKLGFSEKDHKAIGLSEKDGRIHWENNDLPLKEIQMGPAVLGATLIVFRKLDHEELLTFEHLPMYEKLLKEEAKSV